MISKKWAIYKLIDTELFVVPTNDKYDHDIYSVYCSCEPTIEIYENGFLCTHNAFDFRDIAEALNENK